MAPENPPQIVSRPRDDVAEDFVREFLHQFGTEPSSEVSEDDESFTVRVRIQGVEQSEPQLFVVADTIAIHDSQRTVALVIVHCGSMERWLLLPGAIDVSRVSTEVIDDVLSVTLPKSAPGV